MFNLQWCNRKLLSWQRMGFLIFLTSYSTNIIRSYWVILRSLFFFFLLTSWVANSEDFFLSDFCYKLEKRERERHNEVIFERDIFRKTSVPNFWWSFLDCEYKTYLFCFKISRIIVFMHLYSWKLIDLNIGTWNSCLK